MKRKAVVSFVLVVLFLVSVFPLSTFSGAADSHGSPGLLGSQSTVDPTDWWPMFHHDLTHNGYSTSNVPTTNQTLWNYTTGSDVDCSPAVVGGVVYVDSDDHNVYALNATTGTFIWNYTTGGIVFSSPAVAGGVVYVGSDDSKIYALNATTGAQVWNYATGDYVVSSPAVAGGIVYVGSYDGKIYAFGVHDVAVTNVAPSKTVVGQGFSASINVTVANQGGYTEAFNVTAYANVTAIQTETLTLTSQSSATLTFTWDTTGFTMGNYTLSAYAEPIPSEANMPNNNFTLVDILQVTIPGDINGSGIVDFFNAAKLSAAFNATPKSPNWNPNADINSDGVVDIYDAIILAGHFNQH